jgi:hypothetical protein
VQWLDFKMLSLYGRRRAPVIRVNRGISSEETLVLIAALIPNRRGQPVLNEWFAVRVASNGAVMGSLPLLEVIEATGLGRKDIANAGAAHDGKRLQALLEPALGFAQQRMTAKHKTFSSEMKERAARELERLANLKAAHQRQLRLAYERGNDEQIPAGFARARELKRETKALEIEQLFEGYQKWVRQTLELDEHAHLTVAAVLVR